MTHRQSKIDIYECLKIEVTYEVKIRCCNFAVLMLNYFCLTKSCVTFFRSETAVLNFLHLMTLIYDVFISYYLYFS